MCFEIRSPTISQEINYTTNGYNKCEATIINSAWWFYSAPSKRSWNRNNFSLLFTLSYLCANRKKKKNTPHGPGYNPTVKNFRLGSSRITYTGLATLRKRIDKRNTSVCHDWNRPSRVKGAGTLFNEFHVDRSSFKSFFLIDTRDQIIARYFEKDCHHPFFFFKTGQFI